MLGLGVYVIPMLDVNEESHNKTRILQVLRHGGLSVRAAPQGVERGTAFGKLTSDKLGRTHTRALLVIQHALLTVH